MENPQEKSIFDELNQQYLHVTYASTGERFVNLIIDTLVFYATYFLILVFSSAIMGLSGIPPERVGEIFSDKITLYLIAFSTQLLLYSLLEGLTKGRTVGKYITKSVAVNEDFSPIGMKQAVIRTLCRFIPFEGFAIINGRPLHDSLSKTNVIKNRTFI